MTIGPFEKAPDSLPWEWEATPEEIEELYREADRNWLDFLDAEDAEAVEIAARDQSAAAYQDKLRAMGKKDRIVGWCIVVVLVAAVALLFASTVVFP